MHLPVHDPCTTRRAALGARYRPMEGFFFNGPPVRSTLLESAFHFNRDLQIYVIEDQANVRLQQQATKAATRDNAVKH